MPTIVFDPEAAISREQLQTAFAAENIDARVFFHPLSMLPMFKDKPKNKLAWSIPERAINLPSYHDINKTEIQRVCQVINNLVGDRG